jgi:hypothetical protein
MAKAGRPSTYRAVYCEQVVEHLSQGASLTSFAAEIGVARSTINEWMSAHPEFSDACARAKAKCAAWWERQGREIAQEGGGNGSATLVMFGMKNMGAEDWKDASQIDHRSTDGSMTPKPDKIIIEAAKVETAKSE